MSKPSSECLNLLTNKRLSKLGHAANMLWISFGQDIMVTDYRGKQKCVGEYALHIQCPWRITRKQDVLLSSRDMISLLENDSANSFESKCAYLCSYLKENTELVESVHMNCFGDITIQCTNIQIDSFVCTSGVCESWRLIDFTSGTHYVMEEEE